LFLPCTTTLTNPDKATLSQTTAERGNA
jgi:hypothetical protein